MTAERTTRAQQSRAAVARPAIGGDEKGRLDIDVSTLPNNLAVKWIRESIRGQYDDDNIQMNMERGYRPVEASELPGYRTHRLPGARGSNTPEDTLIRRGGAILMARDASVDAQEQAQIAEETAEALRSVARRPDDAAPKDGKNFRDMDPEVTHKIERGRGRFSET